MAILMQAQTFLIEPSLVSFADTVNITSIELFFKQKPQSVANASGIKDPGISVYVVPTTSGGLPNFSSLNDYTVSRKEFSEIVSSRDAQVATKFSFPTPVPVKPGIKYAVIVKPDNSEDYVLWAATKGEINLVDKSVNTGLAGKFNGDYFQLTNVSATWQPLPYTDLKFKVNIGRYAYNGVIPQDHVPYFTLFMKNYEFVTYNKTRASGDIVGGEYIFQEKTTPDGTCSVVQGISSAVTSGGAFNGLFSPSGDDSYIVVTKTNTDGSKLFNVRKVIAVSADNNSLSTDMPFSFSATGATFIRTAVAKAYLSRNGKFVSGSDSFVVLSDSSANSTVRFTNNSVLIGELSTATLPNSYFNDIIVHSVEPHVYVHSPSGTTFKVGEIFSYTTTDGQNGSLAAGEMAFDVNMYSPINLDVGQPVVLMSRSNEVTLRNWSSKQYSKSSRLLFTVTTTNDYESPQIDYNATDVFFAKYHINNDATNEHTNYGNAISKHVSVKVNFDNNRQAEDILVYLQAYKPIGTDLKVYAKLYNKNDSDYFVDKDWTLLRETSGNRPSSLSNLSDFVEYTYGLYDYSDPTFNVDSTLSGIISIANTDSLKIYANTQSVNSSADFIFLNDASGIFQLGDRLYYEVPTNNTAITGLTGNSYYYVSYTNTSGLSLSTTQYGPNVDISTTIKAGGNNYIYPNTTNIDSGNNFIKLVGANTLYSVGDKVYYIVPTGNTTITGLSGNSYYYISFANNTGFAVAATQGGSNIDISTTVTKGGNSNITANTTGVDSNNNIIMLASANTILDVNTAVYYTVPAGNTAIDGLLANTYYFVSFVNSTSFALSHTLGGANVDISSNVVIAGETHIITNFPETHTFTSGVETHYLSGDANTTFNSYKYNITGIDTNFSSQLIVGDLIKIYPSLFPSKFVITSVYSINSSTSLTLKTPISSTEVIALGSTGLKIDKLKLKHQAFTNKLNSNTVRYFNSGMAIYDKYDSFAIKVVFQSNSQFIIPKVSNVRAIGVSA